MGTESNAMDASVYSVTDYILLLLVILTTVLVLVGALAVISAFAKTVKEAGSMIMPLMVVVMVISVTSMLGSGAPKEFYWYLIPFYNSVQGMTGILISPTAESILWHVLSATLFIPVFYQWYWRKCLAVRKLCIPRKNTRQIAFIGLK